MRLMGDRGGEVHFRRPGRAWEVFVGLVCALCGGGLSLLGGFGLYAVFIRKGPTAPPSVVVVTLIVCALGAMLLAFAWRLISNRARPSDGGLLSPLGLRVGGLIFLASSIAPFFSHWLGLVHLATTLAAAGACFALARHREQHLSGATPSA